MQEVKKSATGEKRKEELTDRENPAKRRRKRSLVAEVWGEALGEEQWMTNQWLRQHEDVQHGVRKQATIKLLNEPEWMAQCAVGWIWDGLCDIVEQNMACSLILEEDLHDEWAVVQPVVPVVAVSVNCSGRKLPAKKVAKKVRRLTKTNITSKECKSTGRVNKISNYMVRSMPAVSEGGSV